MANALVSLMFTTAILVLSLAQQPAQSQPSPADVTSLDLESLMNLDVTTASKFTEKLSTASGVMSVITKDELRRFSGILSQNGHLEAGGGIRADTDDSGRDRVKVLN